MPQRIYNQKLFNYIVIEGIAIRGLKIVIYGICRVFGNKRFMAESMKRYLVYLSARIYITTSHPSTNNAVIQIELKEACANVSGREDNDCKF